jgi:hypothetical protein
MGLALAVFVAPVQAVERSVGGTISKNTKVDVQIETIKTFIESVTTRLDVDINRELGYATENCKKAGDCRIFNELTELKGTLAGLWIRFNALDKNKMQGVETDPYTCTYARFITPSCNLANQRLVWNGSAWECRTKAAWETGGAATCATATIPAPSGCSPALLRNCCDRWICGGSC